MQWKLQGGGNYLLQGRGFSLSFHPDMSIPALSTFTALGSAFGIETKDSETALVLEHGEPRLRILNGDFRAEYNEAFPLGLAACVAVYEKHKGTARCDWSTDEVSHV